MMSYRIKTRKAVGKEIRRIAIEQINKAIAELSDTGLDRHEAVHQARKRFKKIRALVRLARNSLGDTYDAENVWFRDTGRNLSRVRDAEAMIETFDKLGDVFRDQLDSGAFAPVRYVLVRRRKEIADEQIDLDARTAEIVEQLREARKRVAKWRVDDKGFDALCGGLGRTYRRGRKALAAAYAQPRPEAFHEWRKRVKYHWYHVRLLRDAWPRVMKAHRRCLKDLADLLGASHDLAVFQQAVRATPEDFGDLRQAQVLLGLAERRQTEFRARARPLGRKVFAEKPKYLARRLREYWNARDERLPLPKLAPRRESRKACF